MDDGVDSRGGRPLLDGSLELQGSVFFAACGERRLRAAVVLLLHAPEPGLVATLLVLLLPPLPLSVPPPLLPPPPPPPPPAPPAPPLPPHFSLL